MKSERSKAELHTRHSFWSRLSLSTCASQLSLLTELAYVFNIQQDRTQYGLFSLSGTWPTRFPILHVSILTPISPFSMPITAAALINMEGLCDVCLMWWESMGSRLVDTELSPTNRHFPCPWPCKSAGYCTGVKCSFCPLLWTGPRGCQQKWCNATEPHNVFHSGALPLVSVSLPCNGGGREMATTSLTLA